MSLHSFLINRSFALLNSGISIREKKEATGLTTLINYPYIKLST